MAAAMTWSQPGSSRGGEYGGLVGPGQVRYLMGDVPSDGRRRGPPARLVERGDEVVELGSLRGQVRENGVEDVHAGSARCTSSRSAQASRMRFAAPAIVTDRVREPEPADEVEGRLDQLPGSGPGLVHAQQVDGQAVHLPADALLERADRGQQLGVGAGRDPQLEGGGEDRAGEVLRQDPQHRPGASRSGRQRRGSGPELGPTSVTQVLDRGQHQGVLGREVVQLGAARNARALRDHRGRRTGPAALDQGLDRGFQQPRPHRAGPFLLGNADAGHLSQHVAQHQKQSSLTFSVLTSCGLARLSHGQVHRRSRPQETRCPTTAPRRRFRPARPPPTTMPKTRIRPAGSPTAPQSGNPGYQQPPPYGQPQQPPPYASPSTAVRTTATPRRTHSPSSRSTDNSNNRRRTGNSNSPTRRPVSTAPRSTPPSPGTRATGRRRLRPAGDTRAGVTARWRRCGTCSIYGRRWSASSSVSS